MPRKYIKKNLRKQYSENDFKLAVEAVSHGFSIREATIRFHVPYTTLNSHVNNYVLYDYIGRPTKFTKEEEGYLEQAALVLQVK
jgi:response regulator of citrate/malate metabolism